MTQDVLVRKYGTMLEVSYVDGRNIEESHVLSLLRPAMTYTHVQFLYGYAQRDEVTGARHTTKQTRIKLYRIRDNKLVTCCGYLQKIQSILSAAEYGVNFVDYTPPSPRELAFEPDWENVNKHIEFRARQEECLRAIVDNDYGVIDAPPAFGKSHLMAMVGLLFPKAKIHIVTRRKDVVQRTVRALRRFLPNVGQVGGGKREEARVTVFTADSLHHSDGDCDILLADEVHELMSPKHSAAIAKTYTLSRNYGLTATPEGRADGSDAKLEYLFGPKIFEMPWTEATELGLVVPIQVIWLPIQCASPCDGMEGVPKKRHGVWRNGDRNAVIASAVRQYGDDDQVLILVETIEHAVYLWQELPEYELCYANIEVEDLDRYKRNDMLPDDYEAMTPERRERLRTQFEDKALKKVIATDVWSTGVSFEQLAVLVRADARGSEILDTQAPGRVARIHEESGKQVGIVVDCMDNFDRTLKNKSQKRYRNYAKKGWEQIKLTPQEIADA